MCEKGVKAGKIKSGYLDKPRSEVVQKLRWPHMYQNPRYVTAGLMFNQLTFPQFVGGECRTILHTNEAEELCGRLRILSKVAYLYEQCRNWDKVRSAYFAIISSIEEGDADWSSSFGHYDMMCPPVNETEHKEQKLKPRTTQKREFYCREYQKGECQLQNPHRACIKGLYELVEHFCFQCFKAKVGKQAHVPFMDECMQRK